MARKFSTRRGEQDPRICSLIGMLGGNRACAQLFGVSMQAITNWKRRGLPPETYHLFVKALKQRGHAIPPSPELWGMHVGKVPAEPMRGSKVAAE
jgi:hypothetical protein